MLKSKHRLSLLFQASAEGASFPHAFAFPFDAVLSKLNLSKIAYSLQRCRCNASWLLETATRAPAPTVPAFAVKVVDKGKSKKC